MADGTLIFDTKLDNSGLQKGLNEAGAGFEKTGGKAAAFGKVALGAAVAAGAGMVALGKKSLELYADYEQLKGGVETLFKESSDTVLQYAQDAYKTAGLSANEYMETITGFSASLLQSLGGDTAKAAEYGNQAVIDMSDNANKMGTDIARIQDAYQGFAKQNFTMLDNLKLGYGGTRTEMQRLLDDAEKLTGKKYDISNFADITEAIHAIQTEMEITGTTAEEASKTIQGSIGMLKSSWQNLLTGLGDPEADIDQLVQNVIESVQTVIKNILPRLQAIAKGMFGMFKGLAKEVPGLVKSLLPALIDGLVGLATGIMAMIPSLINMILECLPALIDGANRLIEGLVQALPTILNALVAAVPTIIQALIQVFQAVVNNIGTILPILVDGFIQLTQALIQALPQIVAALIEAVPQILKAVIPAILTLLPHLMTVGIQLMNAVWDGIKQVMPKVLSSVLAWAKQLPGKIRSGLGTLADIAKNWIQGMINTVKTKITELAGKCLSWAKQLPQKIKTGLGNLAQIGRDFIAGLWKGIKEKWDSLVSGLLEKVGSLKGKIASVLGISSPSKVMAELGQWIPAGLAVGIEKNFGVVEDAISALGEIPSKISISTPVPIVSGAYAASSRAQEAAVEAARIVNQTINFNQPVQTPAETARMLRNEARFGLLGGTA